MQYIPIAYPYMCIQNHRSQSSDAVVLSINKKIKSILCFVCYLFAVQIPVVYMYNEQYYYEL